jgi:DNA end-binding protein Ku
MPSTVWKGHLTFGLVSIPVKLFRAARAEKVSFRQLHAASGQRVRQSLYIEPPEIQDEPEEAPAVSSTTPPHPAGVRQTTAPMQEHLAPSRGAATAREIPRRPEPEPEFIPPAPTPPVSEPQVEVRRDDVVKGYEFSKDRYVTFTKAELAAITPKTAREMQILEFVQLSEVDPIYYETSYYAAPDKGGERAYALLFEALRRSGHVGLAQVAMHNREHIVLIRPGRTGIVLHTMFYENEVRRADEYRTDTAGINEKEVNLANMLIETLKAPFEPAKYRDTYRDKLEELISAKMQGAETVEAPEPKPAPVINILEALQRSLEISAARKPAASEKAPEEPAKKRRSSKR